MDRQAIISNIVAVGRLIRSRLEGTLPHPYAQCEVLRVVEEFKRPSMQRIAAHFRITAPSATTLVDPLVKGKLLARVPDARDRRQVRVMLTSKGRDVHQRITKRRAAVIGGILKKLGEKDVADLDRILATILATT